VTGLLSKVTTPQQSTTEHKFFSSSFIKQVNGNDWLSHALVGVLGNCITTFQLVISIENESHERRWMLIEHGQSDM